MSNRSSSPSAKSPSPTTAAEWLCVHYAAEFSHLVKSLLQHLEPGMEEQALQVRLAEIFPELLSRLETFVHGDFEWALSRNYNGQQRQQSQPQAEEEISEQVEQRVRDAVQVVCSSRIRQWPITSAGHDVTEQLLVVTFVKHVTQ